MNGERKGKRFQVFSLFSLLKRPTPTPNPTPTKTATPILTLATIPTGTCFASSKVLRWKSICRECKKYPVSNIQ